jgi:hypothetical protein
MNYLTTIGQVAQPAPTTSEMASMAVGGAGVVNACLHLLPRSNLAQYEGTTHESSKKYLVGSW